MDTAEKRRLKKAGKAEVERRSRELRDALAATNTAPFASDEYLRNEIAIRHAEKRLRRHSAKSVSRVVAERDFVLLPLHQKSDDSYGTAERWWCHICDVLVPTAPAKPSRCACANVYIEPLRYERVVKDDEVVAVKRVSAIEFRDRSSVEMVRLIARPRAKRWWEFWR